MTCSKTPEIKTYYESRTDISNSSRRKHATHPSDLNSSLGWRRNPGGWWDITSHHKHKGLFSGIFLSWKWPPKDDSYESTKFRLYFIFFMISIIIAQPFLYNQLKKSTLTTTKDIYSPYQFISYGSSPNIKAYWDSRTEIYWQLEKKTWKLIRVTWSIKSLGSLAFRRDPKGKGWDI